MPANQRTIPATGLRSADVCRHICNGVHADQLDAHEIFAAASRIEPGSSMLERLRQWLRRPDPAQWPLTKRQLPASLVWAVWESVIVSSKSGLEVAWRYGAEVKPRESIKLLRMVATTSATIEAALENFVRYSALVAQVYEFSVARTAAGGTLRISGIPARLGAMADVVYLTSVMLRWATKMLGRDLRAAFRLALPWPGVHDALAQTSGLELVPDADGFALFIDAAVWTECTRTHDPALNRFLEEQVKGEFAQLWPTMQSRVREAIAGARPEHHGANEIARRCGVSARTMRRELLAKGQSFHGILNEWRRGQALAWLDRESDGELAARLGFADARVFRRAFTDWTGMTPNHARLQNR